MLASITLLATDAAAEADKEGLPQFDFSTFEPQIAWLVLTLVVLYIVVARLVVPSVGSVIEDRDSRISGDIDHAHEDREQAEKLKHSAEAAAAEARSKAQTHVASAKADAASRLAAKSKALDEELSKEALQAEERIGAAKSAALADIAPVASAAVIDIAQKVAGVKPDGADIDAAVATALNGKGN